MKTLKGSTKSAFLLNMLEYNGVNGTWDEDMHKIQTTVCV